MRRLLDSGISLRAVCALVAVLVTTAACSSESADESASAHFADAVLVDVAAAMDVPATTAPPEDAPTIEVPEGCVLEEAIDEYGFPIDVVRCDGAEPAPTTTQGPDLAVGDWVGSDEASALSSAIRDALVLQTACGDVSRLDPLNTLVASTPDEVREPLVKAAAELAQAALFCNRSPEAWQDHMDLAIAYLQEFVTAVARESRS